MVYILLILSLLIKKNYFLLFWFLVISWIFINCFELLLFKSCFCFFSWYKNVYLWITHHVSHTCISQCCKCMWFVPCFLIFWLTAFVEGWLSVFPVVYSWEIHKAYLMISNIASLMAAGLKVTDELFKLRKERKTVAYSCLV